VGPELLKGIAAHPAKKPQHRAERRIANRRLTVGAPSVGDKIIARNRDVAGISGPELAPSIPRHKSHPNDVADASSERLRLGSHIAWILPPQRAQAGFHGIAHRYSGQAHPITLAEAVP